MIKLIDDTNVITDQWGFTEFWFCNPPTGGYKEWEFSISLPYDFIRGGENSKYVGSIHICLNGETNWTLENLVIFYLAEKFGYEVVMYGHKNLLPFFSLVSHKAIVSENTHLDRKSFMSGDTDLNYFNELAAENKFPDSFCSWRYNINKLYHNDLAHNSGISLNRPDRLLSPYVRNQFFIYDGNLVGPPSMVYAELIEKCEYFPTTEELVEFYSKRDVLVLKSIWENCFSIKSENPYWEDNKRFWVEYKDGAIIEDKADKERFIQIHENNERELISLIGENYVTYSLSTNGKKMQYWIWENYAESFLTYQLYCSLVLNMQFCTGFGSSNFLGMIPQLNVFFSWVEDPVFSKLIPFKKSINKKLFGHESFLSHWRHGIGRNFHGNFIEKVINNEIHTTK